MDPKMKNPLVEQRKKIKELESTTDYYDRISNIRATVAANNNTGWREDVERDEGGKFTWLRSQE